VTLEGFQSGKPVITAATAANRRESWKTEGADLYAVLIPRISARASNNSLMVPPMLPRWAVLGARR